MHMSAVISILIGAGALAQPHIKHAPLHHHHRRDQIKQWDEGNVHYVEDIVDVYVTEDPGQAAPPATSSTPLAIKEDYVKRPQEAVTTTLIPSVTPTPVAAAAQEEKYAPPQQHQQPSHPAYQPEQPSPSPSSTPSSGSNSDSSTTYWSTSPNSPPSSSGTSILTRANYWRSKWLSLPPFTWSATLAKNAYTTTTTPTTYTTDPKTGLLVPHGESDGTIMGHMLNPGSFAQCIAEGNNEQMNGTYSPFDVAFLMWICEEPNGLVDCEVMGEGGGSKETGHAEIIRGGYTEIGCFWMGSSANGGGMWTCDFTGGPGTTG